MNIEFLVVYATLSFFYVISPGPAIFLAISNGMTGHTKAVLASTFGNILGLFILSVISILGLGSIIVASATLFFIIKLIGAGYLIYLGVKQFIASNTLNSSQFDHVELTNKPLSIYFKEGFLLASSNPKAILFFIAIFPQFLDIEQSLVIQFFTLTFIFMALSFISLMTYGQMGKSSKKLFKNKTSMAWFHRVTGGLFIVMGLALLKLKNAN